jgi:hypothetical protein
VDRVVEVPQPANASAAPHTAASTVLGPFIRARSLALPRASYDPLVIDDVVLVLQIPQGSPLADALAAAPPAAVVAGNAIVEHGPVDDEGVLEPPAAGTIVLAVPSPESLAREPDEVHRVLSHHEIGEGPLVVVIEEAEELRDEELAAVVEGAKRATLPVILRVIRGA